MLSINTNMSALIAARYLDLANAQVAQSSQRLSSGYRINSAADDPAGLAIATGLGAQIGGLKVAVNNTQDVISIASTADSALGQTTSILQQMLTLATANASGGTTGAQKAANNAQFTQLQAQLDQVANSTNYNGTLLLDGSYNGTFQVGAGTASYDQMSLDLSTAAITASGTADGSGITGLTADGLNVGTTALTNGIATAGAATTAITAINKALTGTTSVQTMVGANENAFTYQVSALNDQILNLSDAQDRIMSVDVAAETTKLSQAQILSQSAAAMLSQANSQHSTVLRLLLGISGA